MTEEERAAAYRANLRTEAQNKRSSEKRLAGQPARKATLLENTKALLQIDEHGVRRC